MGLITLSAGLGAGQLEQVLNNLNSVPLKDCHLVKINLMLIILILNYQ